MKDKNIKILQTFTVENIPDLDVAVLGALELFISFGEENKIWGDPNNRLNIPLPKNAGYVAMMAIGQYVIS